MRPCLQVLQAGLRRLKLFHERSGFLRFLQVSFNQWWHAIFPARQLAVQSEYLFVFLFQGGFRASFLLLVPGQIVMVLADLLHQALVLLRKGFVFGLLRFELVLPACVDRYLLFGATVGSHAPASRNADRKCEAEQAKMNDSELRHCSLSWPESNCHQEASRNSSIS